MLVAVISLPEIEGGYGRCQNSIQLGALMTDASCSVNGDQRLREHDPLFREIVLGLDHLGKIGHLDAAEAVLAA
jgi:hypothetical protein